MAAYSYCTIEVGAEHAEKVGEHNQSFDYPFETWANADGSLELIENEARYGFPSGPDLGDSGLRELIAWLITERIPFDGYDGGEEWGPREFAWRPGFDQIKSRPANVDRTTALLEPQFRQLEADSTDCHELADKLRAHFGDDPAGWIE